MSKTLLALLALATLPTITTARAAGVEDYYQCLSQLAWATPMTGEDMVRHNVLQKATIAGQPVYALSSSIYPPTFEEKTYFFGTNGAVWANLSDAVTEHDERRYREATHRYVSILVPGVPSLIDADLSFSRAWTGLDTTLKAYDPLSDEGRTLAEAHLKGVKPIKTHAAPQAEALAALNTETALALAEVTKTKLSSLEKMRPEDFKRMPYAINIFDRFKQALGACAVIDDPMIQEGVTAAEVRVAAELTVYMQRYPTKKLTAFESVCKFLGLED